MKIHKISKIFAKGIAGLDNAAGYVKYNVSRRENESLNDIISREEKKDKLLMVFQLTWDDGREKKIILNIADVHSEC